MKVILRGSPLPLKVLGLLVQAKIKQLKATLTQGAAGPCRVGMSAADLAGRFGSGAVAKDPGCMELYLGEVRDSRPDLIARLAGGTVYQIRVYSRELQTAVGFGVGCSGRDLSRFYQVFWQDANTAYVPALGMDFEVHDGKIESIVVS